MWYRFGLDKLIRKMRRIAQRGEFWLIGGQAMFADGDIGDVNHEGMVIDTILSQYDLDNMNMIDLEQKALDENKDRDTYLRELGMTDAELDVVRGLTDAREYGLQHLGWIRVVNDCVQTQTLNTSIMNDIANGLWEAYDEDVENMTFDVEIYANKTLYRNIPYSILCTNNPAALLPYKSFNSSLIRY